ncbi:MAG: FecR domain-containing protein [bacterium]|nr:FecR domain-containing protein [bacterium]
MKRYIVILFTLLVCSFLVSGSPTASDTMYGHISYVESNPKIIRADKTQQDAVVNMPLAAGDSIVTNGNSRCEFQFDNGTVLRMDKNSRMKITTVLAESLTSKWKITTLELFKGKVYTLNQAYNNERFQIITPNAAVHLKRNSVSTIDLHSNGDTHMFADQGKFKVMFGSDAKNMKKETVKKSQGFLVTASHKFVADSKRDIDFLAWNQYIDKNFKELHHGISKLPKELFRFNKGIVNWVKKWSTVYGEWIYDDIFGYVWKPGDEQFLYSQRPFFHASFVKINNQTFVVPTQSWAWIPSQMGTWVWMKKGWTWVPGQRDTHIFPYSAEYQYPMGSHTLYYWMYRIYGNWDLYHCYRQHGYSAWQSAYYRCYNRQPRKISLKEAPKNIRTILKRIAKVSPQKLKQRIGKLTAPMKAGLTKYVAKRRDMPGYGKNVKQARKPLVAKSKFPKTKRTAARGITGKKLAMKKTKVSKEARARYSRDWNPDKSWSLKNKVPILYSSRTNEVVCPKMRLSSRTITVGKRAALREGRFNAKTGFINTSTRGGSGSSSGSSSSSSSSSSTSPSSSGRSGSGYSNGSKGAGDAQKKG